MNTRQLSGIAGGTSGLKCVVLAEAGHLLPHMAGAMNLPVGLPIVCGAGDQETQAIGNGII